MIENGLTQTVDRYKYHPDMSKKDKEIKEDEVQVLVRLAKNVHIHLEEDAGRCKRSIKGQVEAILTAYYELGDVELKDVEPTRRAISPQFYTKSTNHTKVGLTSVKMNEPKSRGEGKKNA
jgi:hypothetical protein